PSQPTQISSPPIQSSLGQRPRAQSTGPQVAARENGAGTGTSRIKSVPVMTRSDQSIAPSTTHFGGSASILPENWHDSVTITALAARLPALQLPVHQGNRWHGPPGRY